MGISKLLKSSMSLLANLLPSQEENPPCACEKLCALSRAFFPFDGQHGQA
jgi:hypothetical protein